jgi:hypothetical protein
MKTLNQTKFIELFFNQTPLNFSENWDAKLFFVISALFFLLTIFLRCDRKKEEEVDDVEVDEEVEANEEKNNHKRSSEMIYNEDHFKNIRQFVNHLNQKEKMLTKQLEIFQKINQIEELSIQLEKETKKGNIYERINKVETYVFNISDFNRFCSEVYEDVKEESRCKKRPRLMKKIGNMWKEMSDEEKMMHKD